MNIKSPRAIRGAASESLSIYKDHRKTALVYVGISGLLSLAITVISYILSLRIDQMTGLSNMGTRAVLSTLKMVLPVAHLIFLMGWEMGYIQCALRYARRRYVEPMDLKNGFGKFWLILRTKVLMAVVYIGVGIVAMYASCFIFMALPISNAFYELMLPLMESATLLNPTIVIDEATLAAASAAMWPAFVIFGVIFTIAALPVYYGFRMVSFRVADNTVGALAAMKESRTMLKGHKWDLFKLDLSFWWFFLLEGIIITVSYLSDLLPKMGIALPWSGTVSYYVCYVVSLVGQVLLYWAWLNRVTVSRAVFYDAIRPQDAAAGGVTLGNIFDLAKDHQE